MDRRSYVLKGVLPIVGTALLWGAGHFAAKIALSELSALSLTFFSSVIGAFVLIPLYRLSFHSLYETFMRDPLIYFVMAFCGVTVASWLMYFGLSRIDLGISTIIQNLYIVFTPFLAYLVLGERMQPRALPFAAVAIVSTYFVAVPFPFQLTASHLDFLGLFALLGAALCWSVSAVFGKLLVTRQVSSGAITFIRFGFGSVLLLPALAFEEQPFSEVFSSFETMGFVLFLGIFSIALAYVLLYEGLKLVDISTCVFFELLSPVVSLMLGVTVLQERLSGTQKIAIPVLLLAIYLFVRAGTVSSAGSKRKSV